MIAVYARQLGRCRTVNELNRLNILLENRMTPLELAALPSVLPPMPRDRGPLRKVLTKWCYDSLPRHVRTRINKVRRKLPRRLLATLTDDDIARAAHEWVGRINALVALSGKPQPEPYVRTRLAREMAIYRGPGARENKTLLILFAGNAQRVMLPLPVFIQHLDARQTDVVLLRDPQRAAYRQGLWRFASTLDGLADALPVWTHAEEYRAVEVLGTSGGGLPAVMVALQLGAAAVVSVGGNGPDDARWTRHGSIPPRERLQQLRAGPGKAVKITLAFGAQSPRDETAARELAALVGADCLPVSDADRPVGHGALFPLAQRGRLVEFLDTALHHRFG